MATAKQVEEALKASGWKILRIGPASYVAWCPSTYVERETPEGTPERWWRYPTYQKRRGLSFTAWNGKIDAIWSVEQNAPWVPEAQHRLSFKKALEYLAAEVE